MMSSKLPRKKPVLQPLPVSKKKQQSIPAAQQVKQNALGNIANNNGYKKPPLRSKDGAFGQSQQQLGQSDPRNLMKNGTNNSKMISKRKPNGVEPPRAGLKYKEPVTQDSDDDDIKIVSEKINSVPVFSRILSSTGAVAGKQVFSRRLSATGTGAVTHPILSRILSSADGVGARPIFRRSTGTTAGGLAVSKRSSSTGGGRAGAGGGSLGRTTKTSELSKYQVRPVPVQLQVRKTPPKPHETVFYIEEEDDNSNPADPLGSESPRNCPTPPPPELKIFNTRSVSEITKIVSPGNASTLWSSKCSTPTDADGTSNKFTPEDTVEPEDEVPFNFTFGSNSNDSQRFDVDLITEDRLCDLCGYTVNAGESLEEHVCEGLCDFCGIFFIEPAALQNHLPLCIGERDMDLTSSKNLKGGENSDIDILASAASTIVTSVQEQLVPVRPVDKKSSSLTVEWAVPFNPLKPPNAKVISQPLEVIKMKVMNSSKESEAAASADNADEKIFKKPESVIPLQLSNSTMPISASKRSPLQAIKVAVLNLPKESKAAAVANTEVVDMDDKNFKIPEDPLMHLKPPNSTTAISVSKNSPIKCIKGEVLNSSKVEVDNTSDVIVENVNTFKKPLYPVSNPTRVRVAHKRSPLQAIKVSVLNWSKESKTAEVDNTEVEIVDLDDQNFKKPEPLMPLKRVQVKSSPTEAVSRSTSTFSNESAVNKKLPSLLPMKLVKDEQECKVKSISLDDSASSEGSVFNVIERPTRKRVAPRRYTDDEDTSEDSEIDEDEEDMLAMFSSESPKFKKPKVTKPKTRIRIMSLTSSEEEGQDDIKGQGSALQDTKGISDAVGAFVLKDTDVKAKTVTKKIAIGNQNRGRRSTIAELESDCESTSSSSSSSDDEEIKNDKEDLSDSDIVDELVPLPAKKVKPFCEICNKKFDTMLPLIQHLIIHAGVAPYECDKCAASFNRPMELHRHCIATHRDVHEPRIRRAPKAE